jgi:hypothetical protein
MTCSPGVYYNIGSATGEVAWRALVDGQVGPFVSSPLRLCQVGLGVNYQEGPQESPTLFIFSKVDFSSLVERTDVDLLCSNGESVYCFEVKDNAASLCHDQFGDLIAICERLGARPSIAGLRGCFSDKQRQEVVDRGGMVFESDQLLHSP